MFQFSDIIKCIQTEKVNPNIKISYGEINKKKIELVNIGITLGCFGMCFERWLSSITTSQKFSRYSLSKWGYFSPSILDEFVITNVKKPMRICETKPKSNKYYRYLFHKNELVCIDSIDNNNTFDRKYICCFEDCMYSFKFFNFKNRVDICQAVYNEKGDILSFASIITAGIPEEDFSEEKVKNIIDSSILDFQYYHYDENGNLDYADDYRRVYNFSPQLLGMPLGKRYKFIYDENGKIIDAEFDETAVPCVFELEYPEYEKFDPRNRSYELLKKMQFL